MATITDEITIPTSGDVTGNGRFTSYGNYTVSPSMGATVTAWISNASTGTLVVNGTSTTPPPGYNWAFKFSGLSLNVEYYENVEVTAADNTTNTVQVEITCTQ
jgi:hypothetical protein